MQRFSAWVLWIIGGIFTLIILPFVSNFLVHMAENYGWYDREALPNAINVFLNLAEQPWFRVTALVVGSFVAGMLVDRLLRKLDGSRADKRKALGTDMVGLDDRIKQLKYPMQQESGNIRSCFANAKKLGLWVPDYRVFQLHSSRASLEVSNYLRNVGALLMDGNFRKAKQYASRECKASFDKACADHGL